MLGHQIEERAHSGAGGYATYYTGMDATALSKLALMTAHIKVQGARIVDLGFGTGKSTHGLSVLYPDNQIIGVDIDPHAIAHAKAHYSNPNLSFVQGDITRTTFAPQSIDAFINCSFLHEVTSYCRDPALRFSSMPVIQALREQVSALKSDGIIEIRDFVKPRDADRKVLLDLPAMHGIADGDEFAFLSKADLFVDFCTRFRSFKHPDGVTYTENDPPRRGWRRFTLDLETAVEFILRKDYTARWLDEIKEQYLYFTQDQFEQAVRTLGCRVIQSVEIHNPWIEKNRFQNQFSLKELNGEEIPFPATNYNLVAQKKSPGSGVALVEDAHEKVRTPSFIRRRYLENTDSSSMGYGDTYEVLERPNPVADLLPWSRINNRINVYVKRGYPRPIVGSLPAIESLDSSTCAGYLIEPITGELRTTIEDLLLERSGYHRGGMTNIDPKLSFLPSPSALNEQVTLYLPSVPTSFLDSCGAAPHYSSFSTSGEIQPLDAQQVLRSAQAGGLFEARVEVGVYALLRQLNEPLNPWIGEKIHLTDQEGAVSMEQFSEVKEDRKVFKKSRSSGRSFYQVHRGTFVEKTGAGQEMARKALEYITPRSYDDESFSCVPVMRVNGEIYFGIEERDLPAAQLTTGSSQHLSVPVFKVSKNSSQYNRTKEFTVRKFEEEFGLKVNETFQLGSGYFTSPGISRERIYPILLDVDASSTLGVPGRSNLRWVKLNDLLDNVSQIHDLNLLLGVFRASHAILSPDTTG